MVIVKLIITYVCFIIQYIYNPLWYTCLFLGSFHQFISPASGRKKSAPPLSPRRPSPPRGKWCEPFDLGEWKNHPPLQPWWEELPQNLGQNQQQKKGQNVGEIKKNLAEFQGGQQQPGDFKWQNGKLVYLKTIWNLCWNWCLNLLQIAI